MKTGIHAVKTIASDSLKDTKSIMGMSSKGMEMAQYFLRDKIYSDKVLAVVREYISNAYDEHIKYNIQQPVKVKLAVGSSPSWIWSVRDYANGLNEHDIRNIFGVYFESTKSNDNSSIGGFGIGSKSFFSYTDTFYVTSHHNGVMTNYVCTLGGGDKGIPLGEIYKISEEPTSEQGIEISGEITSGDVYKFSQTTTKFLKFFSPDANIEYEDNYNDSSLSVTTLQPIHTKRMGDYVINCYDETVSSRLSHVNIRMGGVIYPHKFNTKKTHPFVRNIIVDVPIGSMTIPISRESIENTPKNLQIFEEIDNHINDLYIEESNTLTVPDFADVSTNVDLINNTIETDWFSYRTLDVFPMTRTFRSKINRKYLDFSTDIAKIQKPTTSKLLIYIIPNIQNTNNWHKRLIASLSEIYKTDYSGYAYIKQSDYDKLMASLDDSIDISNCSFVSVKSLKLPKLASSNDKNDVYKVYGHGSSNYYSPEALDGSSIDHLRYVYPMLFDDNDELLDDWYDQDCITMSILNCRTIDAVDKVGTRASIYSSNSTKMVNSMVELGWFKSSSPEYIAIREKLNAKAEAEALQDRAVYNLKQVYLDCVMNPKTLELIKKNPHKLPKFQTIMNNVIRENSHRGRIFNSIKYGYHSKLTRQDIRKILNTK